MDVAPEIAEDDEDDEHPPVRGELFGTETMAELCVRQGRVADALAIYRGLLRGLLPGRSGDLTTPPAAVAGSPDHERRHRWEQRLRDLEDPAGASRRAVPVDKVPPRPAAPALPATIPPARAVAGGTVAGALATKTLRGAIHRLPLVVREPVRAGQIVYAEKNDLIVVGPVNPGAQLIADGNIHVYGRLRGRAVAG
ncbi:MAG: septum site-determining protein MinC, partial [Polyangia bacterium]